MKKVSFLKLRVAYTGFVARQKTADVFPLAKTVIEKLHKVNPGFVIFIQNFE